MKRGIDDEKVMGPMFPRLHVNDAEKGGPRAPPRNKMALYEQLSIPSQRFSRPGMMRPPNHNNNANFVPPASSSSQGNEHEMGMICPVQVPPSTHPAQKPPSHYLVPSASSSRLGQKKKSEEDDLRVPIFVHLKGDQDCGKYYDNLNGEKLSPSRPSHSNYSIKHQISAEEDPKLIGIIGKNVKQNTNNIKGMLGSRKVDEAVSYSQSMTETRDPIKLADMSFSFELRDDPSDNYSLLKTGSRLQPEQRTDSQLGCRSGHLLRIQSSDRNQDASMSMRNFAPDVQNLITDTESCEDRRCQSLQTNNGDQEDDASETSMLDSVSGVDISPDDVVGIMGQKHFWKARREIVNQQRIFAVQVFELHRLIKVQRLIAESSHLLVEENAYLGKPIKVSSAKKLPLEYIGKASSNVSEQKSENPNNKMEFSAENTVGKASQSSVQNGGQPMNYGPFAGNTPIPTSSDPNMGPWGFNQPQGHQWLVPVMSASEGLVYKPYPGPGFTSTVCGGCGPPGSTPVMSNFLPPAYGVPAPHHQYQVMGVPTFVPSIGPHGYFPPYGMQVMNPTMPGHAVEQISQLNTQGLQRQLSGGGANFSVPHQNSSDIPGQKSGADGHTLKLRVRKDSELQGSTASSPPERAGDGLDNTTGRSNPLPLFPTSPVIEVPSGSPRHNEGDQAARVIRVVPHNGRSATKSAAARIFRSIQEERKQ